MINSLSREVDERVKVDSMAKDVLHEGTNTANVLLTCC
jgi:hypothetical protein